MVGYPHHLKGTAICAYVTVKADNHQLIGDQLVGALKDQVRQSIGAIATPDRIIVVSGLPKTRSGKIMRRILRDVASGETTALGDTTTLADPTVLADIVATSPSYERSR